MRAPVVLLVIGTATGCGGSDFEGRWRGSLTQVATCPGGSVARRTLAMDLIAIQDGKEVLFAGSTSCGIITTSVDGDTATLQRVACLPIVTDGVSYADTILGGTMALRGNVLEVSAQASTMARSSTATTTCTGPLTGILSRDE